MTYHVVVDWPLKVGCWGCGCSLKIVPRTKQQLKNSQKRYCFYSSSSSSSSIILIVVTAVRCRSLLLHLLEMPSTAWWVGARSARDRMARALVYIEPCFFVRSIFFMCAFLCPWNRPWVKKTCGSGSWLVYSCIDKRNRTGCFFFFSGACVCSVAVARNTYEYCTVLGNMWLLYDSILEVL